eukprot:11187733-Lingulodinium_polyedra.AAC.1
MRSNRPFAAAAARVSHSYACRARAFLWRAWSARACDSRAIAAAGSRSTRIGAQRLHNYGHQCGRSDRAPPQQFG